MLKVSKLDHPKANFFLIGAAKSGTTSVDRMLRIQPNVYLSPIKEPCFFCDDIREQIIEEYRRDVPVIDFDKYFSGNTREIIHMCLVESGTVYNKLFEGASGQVIGECSTFYLPSKEAAYNIYQYNPSAKIVAILRDPLKRILSHYEMDRRIGITDKPLMQLIHDELALGGDANYGNSRYYVGASRYGEQLQRYYDLFPKECIHVMCFEELVDHPDPIIRELFAFLGLDVPDEQMTLPRENNAYSVRFGKLNQIIYRAGMKPFIDKWVYHVLPESVKGLIKSIYFREHKVELVSQLEIDELRYILKREGVTDGWQSHTRWGS